MHSSSISSYSIISDRSAGRNPRSFSLGTHTVPATAHVPNHVVRWLPRPDRGNLVDARTTRSPTPKTSQTATGDSSGPTGPHAMLRSLPRVAVFLLLVHGPVPSVLGQNGKARPERPESKVKQAERPRPREKRTSSAPSGGGSELHVTGFGYDPAADQAEESRPRQAFTEPHITFRDGGHYEISLNNDLTHQGDSHVEPREYMSEARAIDFLSKLKPGAPFGFPCLANSGTMLAIGWSKRQGKGHWGFDYFVAPADLSYGRELSFQVLAMGSGKVISVQWNDYAGNVVVIEYDGQGGKKYRSIYMHLRNGNRNDRGKAAGINLASYSHDRALQKSMKLYKSFAERWDDQGWWGTDNQTIKVRPGQYVRAGQIIGFAGNTGQFLVDDCVPVSATGIPVNPNEPNIHLHVSFAFFNPEARKWTLIDPYGVYSTRESGGYEPGRPTRFPSFFTEAMSPDFSEVPLSLFAKKFKRYADLGIPLASLRIASNRGGEPTVSGSFDSRGGVDFCARIYTPVDHLWGTKDDWERRDYRPSKAWVTVHPDGVERISAIWRKKKQGERFAFFIGNEQEFQAKHDELKLQGYQLEHKDPPATLASNSKKPSSNQGQQSVVAIFLIPGPAAERRNTADHSKSASSKKPPRGKRYSQPGYAEPKGLEFDWQQLEFPVDGD